VLAPALELRRASVRYGPAGSAGPFALDSASLTVGQGECVGLVGGPGSGTTTLLLCAAGLVGTDAGSARWFGSHRWQSARAAYAPAAAEGHAYLSVRAWLDFSASQRADDATGAEPDVPGAMSLASITEFARIRVGHLTPGVAARVALAGALVAAPRILLCDRPFDALSHAERLRLAQVLGALRREGLTLVVAAREPAALAALAPERVYYIADGRIGPADATDAALELDVPLPIEARSRLALRMPSVYRRGRAIRIPLERITPEQILGECRALGIEVRASRVVPRELPTRRRVAEPAPAADAEVRSGAS
jgi:ABC-type multidrug transport system ATPase subunit